MRAWLDAHRQAAVVAARRLAATPLTTLLGALVIGIALALPGTGQMVLINVAPLARGGSASPELSLFMAPGTERREVAEVEARLQRHAGVQAWRFVSRDAALKRLRATPALGEALDALPGNPLPDAFIVVPRSQAPSDLAVLRAEFAGYPKVEHAQLDSQWANKLDALLALARQVVALLAGLLGVALVAVTFNTIRLQVLTQQAEIELSRLLGATDAFIRRPFYYFAAFQGMAGGAVAWGLVLACTVLLRTPATRLAELYGVSFSLSPLPLPESAGLLLLATTLGWVGARLSLSRHLRDNNL